MLLLLVCWPESWCALLLPCSGGSDWRTVHVMAVDAASGEGRKLSDELQYVKFSGLTWTHDHKARACPAPSGGATVCPSL